MDPPPAWVVIVTKPNAEAIAERSLRQAGYRVYLPLMRRRVYPAGRRNICLPRMVPLLPGYLFVQDWHGWPNARQVVISGVNQLLRDRGGRVLEITDGDVDHLREAELDFDEAWPHRRGRPRKDLSPDDNVRFTLGGEMLLGRLVRLTPNGRAIIRHMLFGREVESDIDAEELAKA